MSLTWSTYTVTDFTEHFWQQYTILYQQDKLSNAFRSPNFVRSQVELYKADYKVLALIGEIEGQFKVAAILGINNRKLSFIPPIECDHETIVLSDGVSDQEVIEALSNFILEWGVTGAYFNNIPQWTSTLYILKIAFNKAGLKTQSFKAWSNPVLHTPEGEDSVTFLTKSVNKSAIRNYQNKLFKLPESVFEARTDGDGLDEWSRTFADIHEMRWNPTPTLSEFIYSSNRERFYSKIQHWYKDGVLVRFHIKVGNIYYAMCLALIDGDRLVSYYSIHHPDFGNSRAATILIKKMVEWAAENKFKAFDFGIGDEGYKFLFSNEDQKTYRLYAYAPMNIKHHVKATFDKNLRQSVLLSKLWALLILNFYKTKFLPLKSRVIHTLWILKNQCILSGYNTVIKKIISSVRKEKEYYFFAKACDCGDPDDVEQIEIHELLEWMGNELKLKASVRAKYLSDVYSKIRTPYAIRHNGDIKAIFWLAKPKEQDHYLPHHFNRTPEWLIVDMYTSRFSRKQKYFTKALKSMLYTLPQDSYILVACNDWNVLLNKSIVNAGFKKYAERTTISINKESRYDWK